MGLSKLIPKTLVSKDEYLFFLKEGTRLYFRAQIARL
ncbi:MAG: hypothetical protein ACJAZX_000916 [Rickettsiales bacterium]|jgi:hypothetical protein